MKDYWVYIIKCSDNSYYTGVTNNLQRRISEHQNGTSQDAYTKSRRPIEVVYSALYHDINQAISHEKQIKGWSRAKKEELINNDFVKLQKLSERKNKKLK
jgi:putative endonuclease